MSIYPAIDVIAREQQTATAAAQSVVIDVPQNSVADVQAQMGISTTGGITLAVVRDRDRADFLQNLDQRGQSLFSAGIASELLTPGRWWLVYKRHALSSADQVFNLLLTTRRQTVDVNGQGQAAQAAAYAQRLQGGVA